MNINYRCDYTANDPATATSARVAENANWQFPRRRKTNATVRNILGVEVLGRCPKSHCFLSNSCTPASRTT